MRDDDATRSSGDGGSRRAREPGDGEGGSSSGSSCMRARTWEIAYRYREPAAYGVPTLPSWAVRRTASGGVAFAEREGADPFVRADSPVTVRR